MAGTVHAQSMRTFSAARQLHGETRLETTVDFAAGSFRLRPATEPMLYRMRVEYDQDRFRPVSAYSIVNRHVTLGLETIGDWELRVPSRKQLSQSASLELARAVDLAVDATFGAADAELELGGLRLTALSLKTGASKVIVRFSEPNATRCRQATFSAGAADLRVYGLGNSRCDRVKLDGGVGAVTLDFTGTWTTDLELIATVAAGELTLRFPETVGVRMSVEKFLVSFAPRGFIRRGSEYLSDNYGKTAHMLDIQLTTTVSGLTVEWLD